MFSFVYLVSRRFLERVFGRVYFRFSYYKGNVVFCMFEIFLRKSLSVGMFD